MAVRAARATRTGTAVDSAHDAVTHSEARFLAVLLLRPTPQRESDRAAAQRELMTEFTIEPRSAQKFDELVENSSIEVVHHKNCPFDQCARVRRTNIIGGTVTSLSQVSEP